MLWFKIIIYFLSFLIPGYLLIWLLRPRAPKLSWVNLALAYGLGSMLMTISLFFQLFIFKNHFSLLSSWLVILIEVIILLILVIRRGVFPRREIWQSVFNLTKQIKFLKEWRSIFSSSKRALIILVVILILINSLISLNNALSRPMATFDSLATWSWKAKILFQETEISFNPETFFYLGGGGHLNYPWHVPLAQYWLQVNLGTYHDSLPNLIFVFYFFALLIVIFHFLKRYLSIFQALVFSFFLSSMPLVFYHAFNAYADLSLTFYISVALIFSIFWLTRKQRSDFYLSAIFWGLSFWIKDAALIFYLAFLLAFLIYVLKKKLRFKDWVKYILTTLLVISPWLIFKINYQLSFSNVGWSWLFQPRAIISFMETMFVSYSWNIWWFIVLIVVFLNFKKIISSFVQSFFWLFLLVSFLGLILLFSFTPAAQYALDNTALSRTLIPLAISSIMAVGLALSRKRSDS